MFILSFKLTLRTFLPGRHFKTSSLCIWCLGIPMYHCNVDCTITLYRMHFMPLLQNTDLCHVIMRNTMRLNVTYESELLL